MPTNYLLPDSAPPVANAVPNATRKPRKPKTPLPTEPLFNSFFLGGFECSAHRNLSGVRLDLIASTGHDKHALLDYQRLQAQGMKAARDGIRWHLIERSPGCYDWSSVLPLVRAAQMTGTQVVWDLCHYGWPDDTDPFKPDFAPRFAALAGAFTQLLKNETDMTPYLAPMNEMSFVAWAGGAVAIFPPFLKRRGRELKRELVRATILSCDAIWDIAPEARIFHIDPIANVVADPDKPKDVCTAHRYHLSQFHTWDMICGRLRPQLGGSPKYLDVVGVNYYADNQWHHPGTLEGGTTLERSHPMYRPVWHLLRDAYKRYQRPIFIAETGIENEARAEWVRYMARETRRALQMGIPIEGICLYPILNHPGWEDDRHCYNALWDYPDENGNREIYAPMAEELQRQIRLFDRFAHRTGRPLTRAANA